MDLPVELNSKLKDLDTSIKSLRKTGREYAEAYTKYRVELAKELTILRNEGYAISLAGDIARGKPQIAHLKYEEICKEAIYKANLESVNAIKLAIRIIENQIGREWSDINED